LVFTNTFLLNLLICLRLCYLCTFLLTLIWKIIQIAWLKRITVHLTLLKTFKLHWLVHHLLGIVIVLKVDIIKIILLNRLVELEIVWLVCDRIIILRDIDKLSLTVQILILYRVLILKLLHKSCWRSHRFYKLILLDYILTFFYFLNVILILILNCLCIIILWNTSFFVIIFLFIWSLFIIILWFLRTWIILILFLLN